MKILKYFPGTWREYWVYVPAQYRPEKPACVYVNQDGIQWKAPTVFDNLIYRNEMPVTIGVFVTPGRVVAANAETANDRFNRSFEYDGLGDAYARFILEEILPEVEKQKTSDGRAIHLSKMGMTGPLADQAAELFALLLLHGNDRKNFPVCLALSAHTSGFVEPIVIQHLLENMNPNQSGSFYRMAPMILIFMAAIGGKPTKQ